LPSKRTYIKRADRKDDDKRTDSEGNGKRVKRCLIISKKINESGGGTGA